MSEGGQDTISSIKPLSGEETGPLGEVFLFVFLRLDF